MLIAVSQVADPWSTCFCDYVHASGSPSRIFLTIVPAELWLEIRFTVWQQKTNMFGRFAFISFTCLTPIRKVFKKKKHQQLLEKAFKDPKRT